MAGGRFRFGFGKNEDDENKNDENNSARNNPFGQDSGSGDSSNDSGQQAFPFPGFPFGEMGGNSQSSLGDLFSSFFGFAGGNQSDGRSDSSDDSSKKDQNEGDDEVVYDFFGRPTKFSWEELRDAINEQQESRMQDGGMGPFPMFFQVGGGMPDFLGGLFNGQTGPRQPAKKDVFLKGIREAEDEPVAGFASAINDAAILTSSWLDEATTLAGPALPVKVLSGYDFAELTADNWFRMFKPLVERAVAAQEKSTGGLGNLGGLQALSAITASLPTDGRNYQAGKTAAEFCEQLASGTDLGLPLVTDQLIILPPVISQLRATTGVSEADITVYLVAREAARQRLFHFAPWIPELFYSAIEEYAAGMYVDTSGQEELDEIFQSGDMQAILEAIQSRINASPELYSHNSNAGMRLATLVGLVEGWVTHVVTLALEPKIPSVELLNDAFHERHHNGGNLKTIVKELGDMAMPVPPVDYAAELWKRVDAAVGMKRRDEIWSHVDFLPDFEQIFRTASYIDTLLSGESLVEFDPVAELEGLEKMLQEEAEKAEWLNQWKAKQEGRDKKSTDDDTATGDDEENPAGN